MKLFLPSILSLLTSGAIGYFLCDLALKVDKRETTIIVLLIVMNMILKSIIFSNVKGDSNVAK